MRYGGIRAAAKALQRPPSSASAALTRLENELNITLLRRTEKGLALTLEGRRCRPTLEHITALLQKLHQCDAEQLPTQSVNIKALFRVAETIRIGSIRRAANHMGLDQPQLTRQIAQIERRFGLTVATRHRSGLSLTDEGRALLSVVSDLEESWRSLSAQINPIQERSSRLLKLGSVTPSLPEGGLARLLAQLSTHLHFSNKYRFSLVSTLADDLLLGLDNGRFDCVFLDARLRESFYKQTEILRDPVALFGCNLCGNISRKDQLRAALRDKPMVVQSRRSGLRQRTEAYLDSTAGPDWRALVQFIEIDSLPIIVSMVQSNKFISVLPIYVAERTKDIPLVPLPPEYDQRILLTWRTNTFAEKIADTLMSELKSL